MSSSFRDAFKSSGKEKPPMYDQDVEQQQSPPPQTHFASLSLHRSDRLRLLQFPQHIIPLVRRTIAQSWYRGIQSERPYAGSYEFKLNGNPWYGQSSDAIPARIVMREILALLYENGWILHASTDISKKAMDKDMLVFRQGPVPPACQWASISFNRGDRMRVIGSAAEHDVIPTFRRVLQGMRMLQREEWKDQRAYAWEFKMYGYPWFASGEETMTTRLLMLRMLESLESLGWSLYASIDQSTSQGSNDSVSETDSWYIVKSTDWSPGMPVFHR